MYWIYETKDAAEAALAEIDAEMGFTGDITSTWATPVQVEAGDHEGAWALPAPPAGDAPPVTLEALPEAGGPAAVAVG